MLIRDQADQALQDWREKEKRALELIRIVGELRFDRSVELVLFRRDIYDARPSKVLNDHLFAHNYVQQAISIETTLAVANAIVDMPELGPARIDIGMIGAAWLVETEIKDLSDFVRNRLDGILQSPLVSLEPKDVVLYGFGRIGRLAARRILEVTGRGQQLRLKAIVLRAKMSDRYAEVKKRASLLESDSVHGDFHGTVSVSEDGTELIVNGNRIQMIFANNPEDIDYTHYGITNALLIDNTGVWRDDVALQRHLRPGIDQVLLTAPGKNVPNIVYGVNHEAFDLQKDRIFCAASCTTNAIVPVLKVLEDTYQIVSGHIETIHAYTSDQNLLDNFHKKPRRGRGAAENMVLTSTGAAKAATKVLPQLAGKLTGNAVRVPIPNVSLAILNLRLASETSVEALNNLLRDAAYHGDLVEQIHYSGSTEYVSSNAVGMTSTSVLDAPSTIVSDDGHNATIYLWYDNEYGYTCQVVRLAKHAAQVRRPSFY
ncbi:MAG: glyceraldehyde-3-phosphate dehydrogenase [Saprospiraceae bacterium]|nr:glyceraldehyde-3-phosphate dehydrogenase [Saprospiraceae bacterium]